MVEAFKKKNLKFHGIPKTVISHYDAKFTSNFLNELFTGLCMQLIFTTMYNPQTLGQIERFDHILKDIFCMYIMKYPTKRDDYLHLDQFSYNNNYQESLKMTPFKVM